VLVRKAISHAQALSAIERMQQELKGMEAAAVLAVSDAHWKTKMNGLRNSVSRQSWRGTFRQPRQLRDRRQDNHP
jgi:hypothetical protein